MNSKDLEYIFNNTFYEKNIYKENVAFRLPNTHLEFLKNSRINYRFNPGKYKYKRSIDILRKDDSIITSIKPPRYLSNSRVGYELVKDKYSTEKLLKRYNINTVESKIYEIDELEKAKVEAFQSNVKSVVIKPLAGTLGKGVMVNVSKKRFEYNWNESVKYLAGNKKLVVQEFIEGFEARATIAEGNLVAITLRVPPYVIGDGKNTISSLIEIKNESRKNCTVLNRALLKKSINMKEFLRLTNRKFDETPQKGEYILLGSVSNFSNGGELINITGLVDESIKEIALNTIAALPGLYTGGVDIIMKSFKDKNPKVLEVNSYPVFGLAAFPTYGEITYPSKVYFEAIIAKDQFINNVSDSYEIVDSNRYIATYLDFQQRRNKLLNDQTNEIIDLLRK